MVGQFRIELLGGFHVIVNGHVVSDAAWRRRKPAALIKLLALTPGHRLHREQIMDVLWPELTPEAAAANLRKALYHARREIDSLYTAGTSLIASDADILSLVTDGLQLDVETFRTVLAAARRSGRVNEYRQALDLYGDGLLPDDPYEEWAVGPRNELHLEFVTALEDLVGLLQSRGDLADAIDLARRLIAAEPLREESHATLLRLCALAGRRGEALRHYEYFATLLESELGIEPGPVTQQLYEEIRCRQAHDPELTVDLWERVGDLRVLSGDASGAAKAFELALNAGHSTDTSARLERKCAEACLMQHRPDAASTHLDAAHERAAEPDEKGRVLRLRANLAWETGDILSARRYAEQARDLAQAHGTPDDLAAAQEALIIVSHFSGRWREGLESELERSAASALGPTQLARVFDIHHCIGQFHLYGDGLAASVEEYARKILDRAEDAGALRAQAFAWCLLGECLLLQARWEESAGCLAQSCESHASLGSRSGALPWQRRAELAVCRGSYDQADAYLRQASAIATVSPMAIHVWGRIYATAAFAAIQQGDAMQAIHSIQAASAAATRYGECPTCSALLNPMAAEAFALVADAETARPYAQSAARVADMFKSSAWRAMAESAAGSVAFAEGDEPRALRHFDSAGKLYERAGQPYWAQRSQRLSQVGVI